MKIPIRHDNETIGKYVKRMLLFLNSNGYLDLNTIKNLQNARWRSKIMEKGSKFPVLLPTSENPCYGTKQTRYYAYEYLNFAGEEYYITSQWYEPEYIPFKRWARSTITNETNDFKADKKSEHVEEIISNDEDGNITIVLTNHAIQRIKKRFKMSSMQFMQWVKRNDYELVCRAFKSDGWFEAEIKIPSLGCVLKGTFYNTKFVASTAIKSN